MVRDAGDPDALHEQVIRSAEDQLQAITDHTQMPAGCLPPIKDAADLEAEALSIPPELVKGILHQGSKLAIGGGSKTYKTWLLIDLALSVAGGRDWWGIPTAKGRVLYINLELQEVFFLQRIQKVREAKDMERIKEEMDIWNLRGHSTDLTRLRSKLMPQIKRGNYSLIIMDPIYKLLGERDENSVGGVTAIMNELESIAVETGAAVVFGTHFSKGNQAGKESIDRISGSGAFARDPDSILILTSHEEEYCYTVEPTLRNFAPLKPFVMRWKGPLFARDDDFDPERLKQRRRGNPAKHYTLEDLLPHVPDKEPIDKYLLRENANRAGIPINKVNPLIDEGIQKGQLHEWKIRRAGTNPLRKIARFPQPQEDSHDLHDINI